MAISTVADLIVATLKAAGVRRVFGGQRRFFAAFADALHGLGLRREDVVVSLVEVGREDRTFGNGEARLA